MVTIENLLTFVYLGRLEAIIFVVYVAITLPICLIYNNQNIKKKNFRLLASYMLCLQYIQIAFFTFFKRITLYGAFLSIPNPTRENDVTPAPLTPLLRQWK